MKITFKEILPNLISGTINKILTEIEYKIRDNGNTIDIKGQLVVIREIKTDDRVTEIRDYIPVEISFPKKKIIKKTGEVSLRLEGFQFDFEMDYTVFAGDLYLTNVEELELKIQEEFDFILTETRNS